MVTPGSPLFSTWALVLDGNWASQAFVLRSLMTAQLGRAMLWDLKVQVFCQLESGVVARVALAYILKTLRVLGGK